MESKLNLEEQGGLPEAGGGPLGWPRGLQVQAG